MATFQSLATTLNADCVELRQRPSDKGMTGQFLIRRRVDQSDFMEIRCDETLFCRLSRLVQIQTNVLTTLLLIDHFQGGRGW